MPAPLHPLEGGGSWGPILNTMWNRIGTVLVGATAAFGLFAVAVTLFPEPAPRGAVCESTLSPVAYESCIREWQSYRADLRQHRNVSALLSIGGAAGLALIAARVTQRVSRVFLLSASSTLVIAAVAFRFRDTLID